MSLDAYFVITFRDVIARKNDKRYQGDRDIVISK